MTLNKVQYDFAQLDSASHAGEGQEMQIHHGAAGSRVGAVTCGEEQKSFA